MGKKSSFTMDSDAIKALTADMEEPAKIKVLKPEEKPDYTESYAKEPTDEAKKPKTKKATTATKKTAAGADVSELQKILNARKGDRHKETVCLTLRPSTKAALFKKAKKSGMSASELADYILADALALLD